MDIEEMLMDSLNKNKFRDFLEGNSPYKISLHEWVSANIPTDVTRIVSEGIYKAYSNYPQMDIDKKLYLELDSMLDGTVFDVYMAFSIIFDLLLNESYGNAPFKLDRNILEHLKFSLIKNKSELINYKEWQGINKENGIWDEAVRMSNILKNKINLSLINEKD